MNDLRDNAPIPVASIIDPVPPRHYYPAPPAPTNWGALALAFGLGAFTGLVATALVGLVFIYAVGRNAENTFQKVSTQVGGPSANPYFTPVVKSDPPAAQPFDHVSDRIQPGDDTFTRVGQQIKGLPTDTPDSQDDGRDKDK